MSHGTTDVCGSACDALLAAKNGPQRHRFVVELAVDLDRKRAFCAAGYKAEAWDRSASEILGNLETWAAFVVHSGSQEQGAVDEGEELRELQRVRGRAETTDYVSWGNRDPDAYERFLTMFFEGVEDRKSQGASEHIIHAGADNLLVCDNGDLSAEFLPGRRQATQAQLDHAMRLCFPSYLTPSDQLTDDQKKGISEFKQDRQGNITIKTHAADSSKEWARLGGHYRDSLKVTYQEAAADNAEIVGAFTAAILAETSEEVLLRVLERVEEGK